MNALRSLLQLLVVVAVLFVGFAAFRWLASQRQELTPRAPMRAVPRVEVVAVEGASVTPTVRAHGVARPRTRTELVAEVAGRVTELAPTFAEGGFFQEGDVLVRLETEDLEVARAAAAELVAASELAFDQESADALIARRDWESEGGGRATPLLLREPQVRRARAAVESARAQLAAAERDVERATIRAPYEGRVATTDVDRGSWVARGSRLASIYATDKAEVELPLADQDLAYLELPLAWSDASPTFYGPPVRLRASFAGRERTWEGRLIRTRAELDPATRMLVGVVEVEDPYAPREGEHAPLHAGLFVEAEFDGSRFEAFELPRRALASIRTEAALLRVFVPDAELDREVGSKGHGRLALRPVHVARIEGERLFVDSGLAPGELVIVSPLEAAVEGMALQLAEPEPDEQTAAAGLASEDRR